MIPVPASASNRAGNLEADNALLLFNIPGIPVVLRAAYSGILHLAVMILVPEVRYTTRVSLRSGARHYLYLLPRYQNSITGDIIISPRR